MCMFVCLLVHFLFSSLFWCSSFFATLFNLSYPVSLRELCKDNWREFQENCARSTILVGISSELCWDNTTGGNFQRIVPGQPGQQHWWETSINCARTTTLVGISRELCRDNNTDGNLQGTVPGQQHWWDLPENCARTTTLEGISRELF